MPLKNEANFINNLQIRVVSIKYGDLCLIGWVFLLKKNIIITGM